MGIAQAQGTQAATQGIALLLRAGSALNSGGATPYVRMNNTIGQMTSLTGVEESLGLPPGWTASMDPKTGMPVFIEPGTNRVYHSPPPPSVSSNPNHTSFSSPASSAASLPNSPIPHNFSNNNGNNNSLRTSLFSNPFGGQSNSNTKSPRSSSSRSPIPQNDVHPRTDVNTAGGSTGASGRRSFTLNTRKEYTIKVVNSPKGGVNDAKEFTFLDEALSRDMDTERETDRQIEQELEAQLARAGEEESELSEGYSDDEVPVLPEEYRTELETGDYDSAE